MASARRSTAVALDFTPIRIDTSYYESNADMVGNMGSFNVAKERLTVSTNSAANQVTSQKRTPSFVGKNEEAGGSLEHLERRETDTHRRQISVAEREAHVHHNELNGLSFGGGGGLGSGSYRESEKSLGTQHNLTLNVMNTSHPARLVMQRSANKLLNKYVGVQPQTPRSRSVGLDAGSDAIALSEFLKALRGLEPISMATSLVQRANFDSQTRSLPRRHMAMMAANEELHRVGPTVKPSIAEGRLSTQPSTNDISVPRRPLSARTTFAEMDSQIVIREKGTRTPTGTSGSFMRPTSASLAMSHGKHLQDDSVTGAAAEHRYVDRLSIGSAPNRFYLSSLPRDLSHVKALAYTVRPSDVVTRKRESNTASNAQLSNSESPQKLKRGFGGQQTFQDMYSAYCEPLVADAPPLFEMVNASSEGGTVDRSKGGVTAAAVAYVFSDRQSASPFALHLTRAEQAKAAHANSPATGSDVFHADAGKRDRVASTIRAPCPPERGPAARVKSGQHDEEVPLHPHTPTVGIDPLKHLRAEDGLFAAPHTARGSFRSSFRRGHTRFQSEQADALARNTLPPGGVISKSARFRTSKVPTPPMTSERVEEQSLPPDSVLQKHVPAARFSSAPREAFSGSKSAENFKRRAPGPGAYAGAGTLGSKTHHRIGSIAACLNAGLI